MKKIFYLVSLSAILLLKSSMAVAHQGCINNSLGKPVCAPPIGDIIKDKHGRPVCGEGQCQADSLGNIICSSQIGGYTTIDARGRTVCTGSCVSASASLCQSPKINEAVNVEINDK